MPKEQNGEAVVHVRACVSVWWWWWLGRGGGWGGDSNVLKKLGGL